MGNFIITYELRATNHDYTPFYNLQDELKAAHLQNSVWLLEHSGTATDVHEHIKARMREGDALCVLELPTAEQTGWCCTQMRATGLDWLKNHFPAA